MKHRIPRAYPIHPFRLFWAICCVFALWALLTPVPATALTLFNAPEQPAEKDPEWLRLYAPHWRQVMEAEKTRPGITAEGRGMNKAEALQWRNLLAQAKTADWAERLRLVNGFFNGWMNIKDADAWGTPEHWSPPEEFIRARGGDCEDYAIAKYYALRFLGVPAESMRLVIIRQVDPKGVPNPRLHAILAMRGPQTWFILDRNVRPRYAILPQDHYKGRFVPLFSMNEHNAWKHLPDPGAK